MAEPIELLQFRFSPYNEKVRWTLDLKGVPHRRISLLPGPHAGQVMKLTGQTATPVLHVDGDYVAGSARILELLEDRFPAPRLIPRDPAERAEALAVERRFDEDWTPRMRRALLARMIRYPGYVTATFAGHAPTPMRLVYRLVFPLVRGKVRRGNGIAGPDSIVDGERAIEEALDFVVAQANGTGYLVDDAFTVADLTAASALATICNPDHPDMKRPEPAPPRLRELNDRYAEHPGMEWVREIYARHRPAPLAE
jgi:glutathione S-transferase